MGEALGIYIALDLYFRRISDKASGEETPKEFAPRSVHPYYVRGIGENQAIRTPSFRNRGSNLVSEGEVNFRQQDGSFPICELVH